MSFQKPWKLVLLLAGIFVAGAVTGAFVTVTVVKKVAQNRGAPEQWVSARLKMITQRLELTPEQIAILAPVMKRNSEDLNQLRQDSMRDTRRLIERMHKDIAAVLTPEQKVKFEELNRQMNDRARRVMEQRRKEGRDRRPEDDMGGPEGPPPGRRKGGN